MAGIRMEFLLLLIAAQGTNAQTLYSIFQTKADCKNGPSDLFHEFYDAVTMTCEPCSQNNTLQKSSSDGLTCECNPGFRYTQNFGGTKVTCQACPADQVTSSDGWECVTCPTSASATRTCPSCASSTRPQVQVGRGVDGNWVAAPNSRVCRNCGNNTSLNDAGDRCVRCNKILGIRSELSTCVCDAATNEANGYCFKSTDSIPNDDPTLYNIPLEAGGSVKSKYFEENLRAAKVLCESYSNVTACQQLANMCVLLLYDRGSSRTGSEQACTLLENIPVDSTVNPVVPTLYYTDDPEDIVNNNDITTSYSFDPPMTMKFKVARYGLGGTFLGLEDITGGLIQLCENTETRLNAAFVFGTVYSSSCSISALSLWNQKKYPLEFFDIYLDYTDGTERRLYKVPLLISNYRDRSGRRVNDGGIANWQLTRRFFLVDNEATITTSTSPDVQTAPNATYVRYAQSIQLVLSLQAGTTDGKINPPYFKITYGEVAREAAQGGQKVSVSFSVTYSMDQGKYTRDFQIATGTLGTLSVLYAGYRTWVWSKRGRRAAIDFPTILNFIFYLAGSLANTFFIITFGISFYWLIFYKRQNAVYLVHPSGQALEDWLALFGSSFALKTLSIIHMMVLQCTTDIFLIDWERPKGVQETSKDGRKSGGTPVSIWRTYFVANEWNEIQATRKISPVLQVFAVVFFLRVVGFENVATMDPDGSVLKNAADYQSQQSYVYRYAVAVLVYLLVAITQWLFYVFIYERFIEDPVRQFVDLCSMSNVSLFIMANAAYGYYIHGRSVHGKADTDMKEMHQMMKREEQDMCGQRGLMPNTEQQTFQMTLPSRLRDKYDQVYLPAALDTAMAGNRGAGNKGKVTDKSVEAYTMLNKFLQAFIDHSLRDLDYVVKDKTLLESVMDTEFFDVQDKGILYNDNGHSFDQVLFIGNESSLIIFDTLLFCIIDLIATDFVLAGVITYLVSQLIILVRDSGGRKNLAKKTLVDERFLI
ncbi:meckelin-like [Haliotis asinina]|uniref:meckelin-like n=1 Tax=Haliotis asinina TaxID=109174 RepID=UPI003531C89C